MTVLGWISGQCTVAESVERALSCQSKTSKQRKAEMTRNITNISLSQPLRKKGEIKQKYILWLLFVYFPGLFPWNTWFYFLFSGSIHDPYILPSNCHSVEMDFSNNMLPA